VIYLNGKLALLPFIMASKRAVWLSCLAVSSCAAAVTAASVNFTADIAGQVYEMTYPILNCMGSSHGSTTLREDWRAHLKNGRLKHDKILQPYLCAPLFTYPL
jgi:hypothetical protein